MRNVVLEGDVLEQLAKIPEKSVQTCVTSPPYWGLRDYGHRRWFGGTLECEHEPADSTGQVPQTKWPNQRDYPQHEKTGPITTCTLCGAWYGQIGLEASPEAYVAHIVEVFQEVRRVLRDDGTLWLNLGDSYANWVGPARTQGHFDSHNQSVGSKVPPGLKEKDLVGIPWMVAFALRADGWYLRSDIIWHKPNVMPESVQDRPTKCHEYIFLLTKSARYFYDIDAIREPSVTTHMPGSQIEETHHYGANNGGNSGLNNLLARYKEEGLPTTRNKRSVWQINPRPYKGAHFATFPEELPEVCIKAGTSEKGCCPTCGSPWERVTAKTSVRPVDYEGKWNASDPQSNGRRMLGSAHARRQAGEAHDNPFPAPVTVGWKPSCSCEAGEPVPCIVLDPFAGSGTTLSVAKSLRRDYVGVELNPEYIRLIEERVRPAEERESERQGFDLMNSRELSQE